MPGNNPNHPANLHCTKSERKNMISQWRSISAAVGATVLLAAYAFYSHQGRNPTGGEAASCQATSPRNVSRLEPSQTNPNSRLTSIISCANSGCHGGASDPENHWKSSYEVWASRDPHALAYSTLWNERSKQIIAALPATGGIDIRQQYCVACHSTVQRENRSKELHFADGVNCQSCHGGAKAVE